ncbi:GNAT family N-acetyltransferase [Glutamicibacter sp. X7]
MDMGSLDLADERHMISAYAVETAATSAVRTGWIAPSAENRIATWRANDGWHKDLVGMWDGTRLCGFAAGLHEEASAAERWVLVWVAPEYQRRGIGSSLVRAVEATSPADTRRLIASAYGATTHEIDVLTQRFALPLGYAVATTETVVELDLRSAGPFTPGEIAGYTIASFLNGVPQRFQEQIGYLKGLVDSEAPSGALDWQDAPVTPAQYVREIENWTARGATVVESIAVTQDGTVVALTCLVVPAEPDRPAQIEGTIVRAEYRGKGLGKAVKQENLAQAARTTPVATVRTSSDEKNEWMRRINSALGFLPVETEAIFHKGTAVV